MIRGVLFDWCGVLTSDLGEAMRTFARTEGLAEDAFIDYLMLEEAGHAVSVATETGEAGQPEFVRAVAERLGVAAEGLMRRISAPLRPDEQVLAAVARLRERGLATAVVSNSWGTDPYDPYGPWRLEERFDALVISHAVRLRKPDPRIYRLACDVLGLDPRECVFVDDTATNLVPARRMGMTAIHHRNSAATVAALEEVCSAERPIDHPG
ncbi:HAD family hydrolase [Nonomuraea typhae]|uniref:HAD family hydrolase n=1 Tax=Nonomuraea typhae TaxID=2603600 RepID=A0ABW7Z7Q2_9ACTN